MERMQSAAAFDEFMRNVWDAPCEPAQDGGTIVHCSPLYDEWHHAVKSAKRLGGMKLWGMRYDDTYGYAFQFDDGSRCWCATNGGAIRLINRRD